MRSILVVALLSVGGLAACSGDGPEPATGYQAPAAVTSTSPAPLPCTTAFQDGAVPPVDDVHPTCADPDGTRVFIGAFRCVDGSHLATVSATSGAPDGWYLAGEAFHAVEGDVADDPGYAEAYQTCMG